VTLEARRSGLAASGRIKTDRARRAVASRAGPGACQAAQQRRGGGRANQRSDGCGRADEDVATKTQSNTNKTRARQATSKAKLLI